MVGIGDYYFSRKAVPHMGKTLFLKDLQVADSPGGGRSLLGSVVQEAKLPFSKDYPVPMHMSVPRVVLRAIESRRPELGLPDSEQIVLPIGLVPAQRSVEIKRKLIFGTGVGPFPSIPLPLNLRLDIDYDRVRKVKLSFGEDTKQEYIPLGYIARLYDHVDGDPVGIDMMLAENNVVTSVLIAKNLSVTLESEEKFGPKFQAKLKELGSIPEVGVEVNYKTEKDNKVVASVSGKTEYLVGLVAHDWDDFKLK